MKRLSATFAFLLALQSAAYAQTVRFQTSLGDIDVTLLPESAPLTVENFLKYLNRGSYTNSFFHRSVPGFIIQGGGYVFENNNLFEIVSDGTVRNEYRVSNTRGTLAMAKLGTDPNSATTQWFFNLANNASNLNNQNGGFTVFGRVANSAGLAVMDRIALVPVYPVNPFDALPLRNVTGQSITDANLIMVRSITVLGALPTITANGVITAGSFGGAREAAPGSFIEIYGTNFTETSRQWATSDFTNGRAPTSLEGVTVTVGGKPAFVAFVSPTQLNVQVPGDVTLGASVPVVVTAGGRASAAVNIAIKEAAGGLLAPPSFNVGGKQYVAAVHHSTGAFVGNGSIPDVPNAPAAPGETLVFYGVGFGRVSSGEVAGEIVSGAPSINSRVEFFFGDIAAQVLYAGLVPGLVGVYQFNVVVPAGLATGDAAIRVLTDGQAIAQTHFLPVRAN